eukprot:529615-Lingulodinium_polyedra.AAC.1
MAGELALARTHPFRTAGRSQLLQDPENQQAEVPPGYLPGCQLCLSTSALLAARSPPRLFQL